MSIIQRIWTNYKHHCWNIFVFRIQFKLQAWYIFKKLAVGNRSNIHGELMIIWCNIEVSCFNVLNSIFCDLENKSTSVESNIHFIIYWYTLLLHQKHVWNIRHVLFVYLGNTEKSISKHGALKTWIETLESNIPTTYIHIFYDVYKNINFS